LTQRQASRLGRIVRGALAIRAASSDATGTSASSAGALALPARDGRTRLIFAAACAALLALAVLLLSSTPPPALAGTVSNQRPFLFAFDGSDTTAGSFQFSSENPVIAVDNSTGDVYVADPRGFYGEAKGVVDRFNANGEAQNYTAGPAAGTSSLNPPEGGLGASNGLAVDNSGVHPGRLYVSSRVSAGQPRFMAFDPSGNLLWTANTAVTPPLSQYLWDVTVDAAGHPWVLDGSSAYEFDSEGSPPEWAGCQVSGFSGRQLFTIDSNGNLYEPGEKFTKNSSCGFTESSFAPGSYDAYANQSTTLPTPATAGRIFAVKEAEFSELEPDGTVVGTYGTQYVKSQYRISAIAYNPEKDWVYVVADASSSDPHPVVAVFGPLTSGSVPSGVTIEAPSAVGVATAHFKGEVNPESLATEAHFEWKTSAQSWAEAALFQSSPPQVLTANNTAQTVEFTTDELHGNTTYEVRLVTVNDTGKLEAFSPVETFTTSTATASPVVTIKPTSPIGTTTATAKAEINPQGDTADWHVERQQGCTGSWTSERTQTIAHATSSFVPVSYDLTGLLPSEEYCVRFVATNSHGTTTSGIDSFTTAAVVPDQVFTAFAAPRLATSARLNGRVNPEGEALTYRFEYSADGGETWKSVEGCKDAGGEPTAECEDTSEARNQIVVAENLSGLEPATTYLYRFIVENAGEPATATQGAEESFTTRTTAEMEPPRRGNELVNNPNKGNQNVFIPGQLESSVSPDGNEALWSVTGGAPGGYNGSQSIFLAKRTPTGWQSRSLAPPAAEQVGEGSLIYEVRDATPDFSRFLFDAQQPKVLSFSNPGTLVRLDQNQSQEVLRSYEKEPREGDMTSDSAHVLVLDAETKQLEDIGSGTPEVVSIMPDGTESSCGLDVGSGVSFIGGIKGSSPRGPAIEWRRGYHMIATTDASRVYFEAQPNGECTRPYGLYVRNRDTETTTLIDPGTTADDVAFIRATPDGREAYFATRSRLDPAADTNSGVDVYRWSEESGESTCLTCVVPNAAIEGKYAVYIPIRISDDFSHIYFESLKQLVPGYGEEGAQNLYVLVNGTVRFVTQTYGFQPLFDAALSHDGNVLVLQSQGERSVTADEVATDSEGHKMVELYRYDDRDGSVECLSCLRGGATTRAVGDGETLAGLQISRDGATVAFVTPEPLSAGDVNRKLDVYEWHDGAVQLVTDGITEFVSGTLAGPHVRGMDSSGSNIFFSVADPGLTGFEEDGLANLYDARIGGGFTPPSPAAHCREDSCQGPLQAAPPNANPTYSGPGNVRAHADCAAIAHRAQQLSARAKHLAQKARRLPAAGRRHMIRTASRLSHRAGHLRKAAQLCRRANRGAGR